MRGDHNTILRVDGLEDLLVTGDHREQGIDVATLVFLDNDLSDMFTVTANDVVAGTELFFLESSRGDIEDIAMLATFQDLTIKHVARAQATDGNLTGADAATDDRIRVC